MSSLPTPASKAPVLEPKAQGAARDPIQGASISLEMAVIDKISFYQLLEKISEFYRHTVPD
jgi:hypothetical protein